MLQILTALFGGELPRPSITWVGHGRAEHQEAAPPAEPRELSTYDIGAVPHDRIRLSHARLAELATLARRDGTLDIFA